MKPWIIDAKDIEINELDDFSESLLHYNQEIKDFLDPKNNRQLLVIAPKGFGKTLLLKAKRRASQSRFAVVLPRQAMIDKPAGAPNIMSSHGEHLHRADPHYWKILWLSAISIAILKDLEIVPAGLSKSSENIFTRDPVTSACDLFNRFLSYDHGPFFALREDYNNVLQVAVRGIQSSVCLFVDNVDEYFPVGSNSANASDQPDYWTFAQVGVALAARDLHSINNHIKVYASIRSEAFEKFKEISPLGLQLLGSALRISYSTEDLIEIIKKNIRAEWVGNLADRNAESEIGRFVNMAAEGIVHASTGDVEDFYAFWLRHTLLRPRDIAFIGEKLSKTAPQQRNIPNARKVVRECSKEIASTYLTEVRDHLSSFDYNLVLRSISKNTLDRKAITDASDGYNKRYAEAYAVSSEVNYHPFCNLYKVGLLGYVGFDDINDSAVQRFIKPGEVALDATHILPDAKIFLAHPILDDIVSQYNVNYLRHANKLNIIGHGRKWRDTREDLYVLKGDIEHSTAIFTDADLQRTYPEFIHDLIEKFEDHVRLAKVEKGDSFTLIDENPVRVIDCAVQIARILKDSRYSVDIRFGGDVGHVEIAESQKASTLLGFSVIRAARIEPHVKPGKIVVTGDFCDTVRKQFGDARLNFRRVQRRQLPDLPHENGRFNFSKNNGGGQVEGAIWTSVYYVTMRPVPAM